MVTSLNPSSSPTPEPLSGPSDRSPSAIGPISGTGETASSGSAAWLVRPDRVIASPREAQFINPGRVATRPNGSPGSLWMAKAQSGVMAA